jgi:hypothetical protein
MTSILLNSFAKEEESIYHRPIFNYISSNIDCSIFNKIKFHTRINIFIISTYSFYDSNNYLIFKLHIGNLLGDNNKIFVEIEFTYSSNLIYYWTQLNNPILNLEWNSINHEKDKINIDLINNFIQTNLSKNKYFIQNKINSNQI